MVENKKVLCLFGNSVYYGHERSNIQVFTLLKDSGMDLHILTNRNGLAPQAEEILIKNNISYTPILFPSWSDVRKPFNLLKILRYLTHVILHNIAFMKRLLHLKPDYIYIANDFMYMSLVPSFIFSTKKIIYRLGDKPVTGWLPFKILWKRYIVKRTHRFVCISKFIKNKLIEAGRRPDSKDLVIYNYPPVRTGKSPEIAFARSGSSEEMVFSYLGQIIAVKGVKMFVEAAVVIAKRFPNSKFLLAGDLTYDASFSKEITNLVESERLSNQILFLGPIDNIEYFFQKTDVLVTPSIKEEPLGNVIVEAKKYHTPSIIFNSGGMPELIKHTVDGYICKDVSSQAIEEAMMYYMHSPETSNTHGAAAFESIDKLQIGYDYFRQNWCKIFVEP